VGDDVTYGYRLLRASGKFIASCPAGDEELIHNRAS